MIGRVAFILDDLFGIPHYLVELGDHLEDDWGVSGEERVRFNLEFCEEFGVDYIPPSTHTVAEYLELVE